MRILVEAANGAVAVEEDRIVEAGGRYDLVVRVRDGEVRPGLINAHDHLHRNHYGRLGAGPYRNAYEWGEDIHFRFAERISRGRRVSRRRALLRGAWKNLLSGVTTVAHHDRWEAAFEEAGFPVRVPRLRWAHSLGLGPEPREMAGGEGPFCIHLAEGTDAEAADEVRRLDRAGLLDTDLLAVHAVGVDDDGIARLRAAGAAIVWCPSSNLFLLGRTAPAALLAPGIDVLLGSDSLLSGTGSLLDELRVARQLGLVSDERLLAAVGWLAAQRLALPVPALEAGQPADLAVFRRPVLEAEMRDVALVMTGGVLRVLDSELAPPGADRRFRGRRVQVGAGLVRWIDQRPTLPRTIRQTRRA
jgi:cytosine/adenosine deaminase-related metal-dependent hydrolase